MLQDDGTWLATLKRDDVELVAAAAERVEPRALVCSDGSVLDVGVIVFATGFQANRFLWPIEVEGRDGRTLDAFWGDDPGAYLGITVPGFPNLYCLYGPGTNLAHAGSIIFHSECQVRYVMGAIEAMVEGGHRVFDCRREMYDDYIRRMDARHAELVWSHPGAGSWYKNAKGRVTTTSPWRLVDYWAWTRTFAAEDYVADAPRDPARRSER
jgi:4-hydroxyacetophenone monooxygenase